MTPVANANPSPIEAKPSPSAEDLPRQTAEPSAQQVQPPRDTALPDPEDKDPGQSPGGGQSQQATDPGTSTGASGSSDPKDVSDSTGVVNKSPSDDTASPVNEPAPGVQSATDLGDDIVPENSLPTVNKLPKPTSPTEDPPPEPSGTNLQNDPTTTELPDETDDPSQPRPIATVGGEPIVAIPNQISSNQDKEGDPSASSNKDSTNSNDNDNDNTNDEQQSEVSDTPIDPKMNNGYPADAAARQTDPSNDPATVPAPSNSQTTIGNHIIQALPQPSAILVDGQSVVLGQAPKTIAGTPAALQEDGDLILGTSTIKNLLPALQNPPTNAPVTMIGNHIIQPLPQPSAILIDGQSLVLGQAPKIISGTPAALQEDGDLILGTSTIKNLLPDLQDPTPHALSNQALTPQVYSVGTAQITAGGPPTTYAGTKIQALSGGILIVGDSTYNANPTPTATPAPEKAVSDGGVSDGRGSYASSISSASAWNTRGSVSGDDGGRGSNSTGSTANVAQYQGSARGRRLLDWRLVWGLVMIGLLRWMT